MSEVRRRLTGYAWISVAAAVTTMALKAGAYLLTGSAALLSDALESVVNLIAAFLALAVLRVAAKAPDEDHNYGHEKAEYFSSGAEGAFILIAAAGIVWTAVDRLVDPRLLTRLELGLAVSVLASLVNLATARFLLAKARSHRSVALEAGGRHLMTDVWSSVGVVAGVAAVALTGWQRLDPIIALAVALHIGWMGISLVRRSVLGLMDTALAPRYLQRFEGILGSYAAQGIEYHALRTRRAGRRNFVSVHLQVPGEWTVQQGHDLAEEVERRIRSQVRQATVLTHLEPLGDPRSWADESLDRED
ncbi:MAG: cation diffusion facilitator family transporter [Acidobacteriota bacterium]